MSMYGLNDPTCLFCSKLAAAYLDHIAGIEWESAGQPVHEQLQRALDAANLPVTTNLSESLSITITLHITCTCVGVCML